MKKERLLICGIIITIGLIVFELIMRFDRFDKEIFLFSSGVLLVFIISGYIIFWGENVEEIIFDGKLKGATKRNILLEIAKGNNPKTRAVLIIFAIVLTSFSYCYFVPNVKNPDLVLSIDEYIDQDDTLIINFSVRNNGFRTTSILKPETRSTIFINITDSNGNEMLSDNRYFFNIAPRIKLPGGESYESYTWYYSVSENYYQYLQESNRSISGREYLTHNMTPPYRLTLTYDTQQVSCNHPVWRGILTEELNITLP